MILVTHGPLEGVLVVFTRHLPVEMYSWGDDQFIPSWGIKTQGWMQIPSSLGKIVTCIFHSEWRGHCLYRHPDRNTWWGSTLPHIDVGFGDLGRHPSLPMTSPMDRVWHWEMLGCSFGMCGMEDGLWRPNVLQYDLKFSWRRLNVTLGRMMSPSLGI